MSLVLSKSVERFTSGVFCLYGEMVKMNGEVRICEADEEHGRQRLWWKLIGQPSTTHY
jgi:hypothetical protein